MSFKTFVSFSIGFVCALLLFTVLQSNDVPHLRVIEIIPFQGGALVGVECETQRSTGFHIMLYEFPARGGEIPLEFEIPELRSARFDFSSQEYFY